MLHQFLRDWQDAEAHQGRYVALKPSDVTVDSFPTLPSWISLLKTAYVRRQVQRWCMMQWASSPNQFPTSTQPVKYYRLPKAANPKTFGMTVTEFRPTLKRHAVISTFFSSLCFTFLESGKQHPNWSNQIRRVGSASRLQSGYTGGDGRSADEDDRVLEAQQSRRTHPDSFPIR